MRTGEEHDCPRQQPQAPYEHRVIFAEIANEDAN